MTEDGRGRLAELEARLARLGAELRASLPERARELRDAAAQLVLDEAGARITIARLAHRLRGTAASYGTASLTEPASRLEAAARTLDASALAEATCLLAERMEQPTDDKPDAAASPAPLPTNEKPLEGMRVLAIDDDEATRRLLRMTLVNLGGADANVESEPRAFFARRASEAFDVVIVDAMMPELDGRACLEQIAAMPLAHDRTRYFILSAAASSELGWSLPPSLEILWLGKPFRPHELLRAIRGRA